MPASAHRLRPSRVVRASVRFTAIAVAATACAYSSMWVAFATHHWSLPPTDGAYGQTLGESWRDPFVRSVALVYFWLGAGLGTGVATWLLWPTRLIRSVPAVFAATVGSAFLTGAVMPMTLVLTLAAGVASMLWCRRRYPVAGLGV